MSRTGALLLLVSLLSSAEMSHSKSEALVVCSDVLEPEALTRYTFAMATLRSLWNARNAAEHANEITRTVKEIDNYFSWMTAMMRIHKASTNDFICAKRSIKPFAATQTDEVIRTTAAFMAMVYDSHISTTQQTLDLLKKLSITPQPELMDRLSTLQVERGQQWVDLVRPTGLVLLSLLNTQHPNGDGKVNRLVISKIQKQKLLDWASDHFPEFVNGTPEQHWSEPAKNAHMYFTFFSKGWKCSDE